MHIGAIKRGVTKVIANWAAELPLSIFIALLSGFTVVLYKDRLELLI